MKPESVPTSKAKLHLDSRGHHDSNLSFTEPRHSTVNHNYFVAVGFITDRPVSKARMTGSPCTRCPKLCFTPSGTGAIRESLAS